ncbi:hypothetical protein EV178_000612 [Coemansia sp. RSA 1646]|nr:hypothetical protein EV178_000612 [Coemansia sp. RSA 1646]
MPQTTDPPAEKRALAHLSPQDTPGSVELDSSTQQHQTYSPFSRTFPQESLAGIQYSRVSSSGTEAYGDRRSGSQRSPPHQERQNGAPETAPASNLATANQHSFISNHHRPASADQTEGAKRPREEHGQHSTHSHAFLHSAQETQQHACRSSYRSTSQVQKPTMAPGSLVAAHESSVSVSPAPSSSAATSSRDLHDSANHTASVPKAPATSTSPQLSVPSAVSAAESRPIETNQAVIQDKDPLPGSNNQNEGVVSDKGAARDAGSTQGTEAVADKTDPSSRADQADDHGGDQNQGETSNRESSGNHQSQKRRLNQACLLCRRKKIRCDSVHPSCSNCNRRGIQCIYPEVRKRGRPPRMYTFADFVQPGQPLPPELQGLSNVHASAMLLASDQRRDQKRHDPSSGASASLQHGWRSSAPGASSSGEHGYGLPPTEGDMSGSSTPAHVQSDYGYSSGLPPLNVAFGRGSGSGGGSGSSGYHHPALRGMPDPMMQPPPPLAVDQAVLDLFEYVIPNFPIVHRQTVVQHIRDRSMPLPLWLAIHAVSARFETNHGGKATHHHHHSHHHHMSTGSQHTGSHRNSGASKPGAGYAEKAHAILVNRFGQRQQRLLLPRSDRSRTAAPRGLVHEFDETDSNLPQREIIELLQSLVLLSIYYSGNWELELAVETHAAAVRIAQRMGVHLLDDPTKLQEANGIFNTGVALNQRKRAQSPGSLLSGSAVGVSARWSVSDPPPLPGGPNDVKMHDASDVHSSEGTLATGTSLSSTSASVSADLRRNWIEFETLRRLWWSMFILDRMYYICAGVPRIIPISGFRVRLPCNDLEWDSMHAQPTAPSSAATMAAAADSNPSSGLMVRTFREAVMHTSLSEQAANEIAATPSRDPEVFRYFAALAGLIDSVVDFGDDIRTLASPAMSEGTEILAQLRIEKRAADQADEASGYRPGYNRSAYGRYDNSLHEAGRSNADLGAKLPSTATWLGSQMAQKQFSKTSHAGWISGSTSSAWPPDWRSRMRVLQERVAALEAQLTEWYSSMPIAQYVRKPYLYSQLPLQDRITYFHQQIVYYGSVIQLQSLVLMTQGLLLPDTVDDSTAAPGLASVSSLEYDPLFGPSALTDMIWRSLMDMEIGQRPNAGSQLQRAQNDVVGESGYSSRRRQFGGHPSWAARRPYRAGMDGAQGDGHSHGDDSANDDSMPFIPLDESGNSPEVIREELQRMVQAAWRRCTEAAIAMSTAVKRATEVRRVASANPKMSYYDPTFRPQALPPYRGDVVSGDRSSPGNTENHSPFAAASSRFGRMSAINEVQTPPQQPLSSTSQPAHGYADGPRLPPIERRESGGPSGHPPIQHQYPQQQPLAPHGNSPGALNAGRFVDSTASPGLVIDDAALFMRYNMLTCTAAYAGAFIHMQNLKLVPRWEEAARGQSEAAAKANEMRAVGDVEMGSGRGEQDLGMLPPPLPPQLPSPPCTADKAREGVKPLVMILESIVPYWRVSGHVSKLRTIWRDIEGSELPTAPLTSPPIRAPAHIHPPSAPAGGWMAPGQPSAPSHPMPMSSTDYGQWGHSQSPAMVHPPQPQQSHYPGQQPQLSQQQQPHPPAPVPPPVQHMPHVAHNQQLSSGVGHQATPQHQHMSMFPPRPDQDNLNTVFVDFTPSTDISEPIISSTLQSPITTATLVDESTNSETNPQIQEPSAPISSAGTPPAEIQTSSSSEFVEVTSTTSETSATSTEPTSSTDNRNSDPISTSSDTHAESTPNTPPTTSTASTSAIATASKHTVVQVVTKYVDGSMGVGKLTKTIDGTDNSETQIVDEDNQPFTSTVTIDAIVGK